MELPDEAFMANNWSKAGRPEARFFEWQPSIAALPFDVPFDREQIKAKVAELAAKGVFIGTSSWKHEGWFNQLYTPAKYEYRGKVATTRFEKNCLQVKRVSRLSYCVCTRKKRRLSGPTRFVTDRRLFEATMEFPKLIHPDCVRFVLYCN